MTIAILTELENVLPRLSMEYGGDAPEIVAHLLALRERIKARRKKDDPIHIFAEDVQEFVRRERAHGVDCPTCTQHAKIYRRPLTRDMVSSLNQIIRMSVTERAWIEAKRLKKRGGDYAKLAYWNLIEFEAAKKSKRRQGGRVRPTTLGLKFALNMIKVPSHVLVYNTNVIGQDAERMVSACDIDKDFDVADLRVSIGGAETLPW